MGYAAAFGTTFLVITRIVDAIDDPLQGWIIDSAKERKFGKYRRFGIIGTCLLGLGTIMLFTMPYSVKSNVVLLWLWVVIGYLLFDMGGAMSAITGPMVQKSTTDVRIRAQIISVLRIASVIAAIPAVFFVSIVTALGKDGDLGQTAVKTLVIFCVVVCLITIIGILLLQEPYLENENKENRGAVSASEIGALLKKNKPLWVHSIGFLIGNMSYGLAKRCYDVFYKVVFLCRHDYWRSEFSAICSLDGFIFVDYFDTELPVSVFDNIGTTYF